MSKIHVLLLIFYFTFICICSFNNEKKLCDSKQQKKNEKTVTESIPFHLLTPEIEKQIKASIREELTEIFDYYVEYVDAESAGRNIERILGAFIILLLIVYILYEDKFSNLIQSIPVITEEIIEIYNDSFFKDVSKYVINNLNKSEMFKKLINKAEKQKQKELDLIRDKGKKENEKENTNENENELKIVNGDNKNINDEGNNHNKVSVGDDKNNEIKEEKRGIEVKISENEKTNIEGNGDGVSKKCDKNNQNEQMIQLELKPKGIVIDIEKVVEEKIINMENTKVNSKTKSNQNKEVKIPFVLIPLPELQKKLYEIMRFIKSKDDSNNIFKTSINFYVKKYHLPNENKK